jgi:hypothetical protein
MGQRNDHGSKRGFKFEMSWTLDEEYQKIVEGGLDCKAPYDDVPSKLAQCRTMPDKLEQRKVRKQCCSYQTENARTGDTAKK